MKTSKWYSEWPFVAVWVAFALRLVVELVLPGYVGIASNGDFGKVYGFLCLAPRADTNFSFFQTDYLWAARNYWNSPYHSSETALGWLATRMAGATHEGAVFNIRWLGVTHAALWLGAFGILLAFLRGSSRGRSRTAQAAIAIVPLLIFTDILYTANLNSFFMDTAAMCGLFLMVAAALWMTVGATPQMAPFAVFVLAALLFVTSKAQHAIWMALPAALLIAWGFQWSGRWRALGWSAALLVLVGGAAILGTTDASYRGQAKFNLLFNRLGPAGADLQSLGVKPEELRYSGMHAYQEGSPAADREWTEGLERRIGFGRLVGWYLRHPASTFGFLAKTMRQDAAEMRQNNLGNFRPGEGHGPGERTTRFAAWSNFRGELLRRWPWHMAAWYLGFVVGCLASRSRVKWVALGVAALGAGEFLAAALGDTLEVARHLTLFQAATDLTVCFAAGWLIHGLIQKTMRQRP